MSQEFDKVRYWKDRSLNYFRSGLREFHDAEKNVLSSLAHAKLDLTDLVKVLNEIEEKFKAVFVSIDSAVLQVDKKMEVKEVAHPTEQSSLPKERLQIKENIQMKIETQIT